MRSQPSNPTRPQATSSAPKPAARRVPTLKSESFTSYSFTSACTKTGTAPHGRRDWKSGSCSPLRRIAPLLEARHHAGNVEDQCHAAVAQHGGARETRHGAEIGLETLDDH